MLIVKVEPLAKPHLRADFSSSNGVNRGILIQTLHVVSTMNHQQAGNLNASARDAIKHMGPRP
jgi:hypothetical protein